MAIWTQISVIIGLMALILSSISLWKQRKTERRIKEKERVREFAENLDAVISRSENILEKLDSPLEHPDIRNYLNQISKDILAYKHEKGENPEIKIRSLDFTDHFSELEKNEFDYSDEGEALKDIKTHYISAYSVDVESATEENLLHGVHLPIGDITFFYKNLSELERYQDLVDDFCKQDLEELEQIISNLGKLLIEDNLESRKLKIEVENYENIEKISLAVLDEIIPLDEVNKNLDNLEEKTTEMKEIRKDLISTSY